MVGGAIVWVFGSLVYVAAIVAVLHRLFRRDGSTVPHPLTSLSPQGWNSA